jgi:hypothetical protein
MQNWPAKDRDAVLDYTYTIPLDAGDSVASYTLEKLAGDVVIDSEGRAGAIVTVWLSGGTSGENAFFRIAWVTAAGRENDDLISLSITNNEAGIAGYVPATAATLKSAFAKFADVSDWSIEYSLKRARRDVDDSWCEDDRAHAEILLAAHYLTLDGFGTGTEAQLAADGLSGMQSIKSGQLSLTVSDAIANAKPGSIEATTYGQRFLELMRKNRGGPRVAPTGSLPDALLYEPLYYVGSSS